MICLGEETPVQCMNRATFVDTEARNVWWLFMVEVALFGLNPAVALVQAGKQANQTAYERCIGAFGQP